MSDEPSERVIASEELASLVSCLASVLSDLESDRNDGEGQVFDLRSAAERHQLRSPADTRDAALRTDRCGG